MRIISGRYRGKRLIAPKRLPVRPTTDMAKEGLFNILNNRYHLEELQIIDLFSGTGNISFEFASRGSSSIIAVDSYAGCVQFISKTAKELELPIRPVKSDVFKFLERTSEKVDIVFADPPYNLPFDSFAKIVHTVFNRQLLLEDGILIVEHSDQTNLGDVPYFSEARKYGGSIFSFFQEV